MPYSLTARAAWLGLFAALIALPAIAADKNFVVNQATDEADASLADGFCDTDPTAGDQGLCTLRAAIQQANNEAPATLHKITFSVAKVTLQGDLPIIIQPTVVDGSGGGPRVEIDGNDHGCFTSNTQSGDSSANPFPGVPEANNSRFEHLVIYGCTGLAAINLNGHGFVVSDSFIGTNKNGDAVASNTNATRGIDIAASKANGDIPNIPNLLPGDLSTLADVIAFIVSAAPSLPPSVITGNVISGNESHGIDIHGKYMATAVVFNNKIGVSLAGDAAIPNGTAGGSAEYGVYVNAGAYLNFIGLNNVIAGHNLDDTGDGVNIATGAVPFPNFVLANVVGASPSSATPFVDDFGNGQSGINVASARPTTQADVDADLANPTIVNPTGLSAIIGPGNVVGHNGQTDADACGAAQINCAQGGILVSDANSIGIRIWGNLVGISDPSGTVDIGNHGDGINVVGTQIEIGGATLVEGNLVASNDRHGIVIRGGTTTNNVTAHANYVGTTPLGGDYGNAGFGVWLHASGNRIGGAAFANERNTIAYNDDDAIKVDGGSSTYGNLIQHNAITNVTGMPIDLDQVADGPDATDNNASVVDRNSGGTAFNYANWQQNTLTLGTPGGAGTGWTLRSSKGRDYRIEFYTSSAPNSAETHLCDLNVTASLQDDTNADPEAGMATGTAGCAAASPGAYITATVTDITATAGTEPDRPGFPDNSEIFNTSELSASAQTPDEVQFSSATYNTNENGVTVVVTLKRTGSGNGAISVDVADLLTGTAAATVDYSFTTPETVNWADADMLDKTVTINLIDDALWENVETVNLQLQNATGASIGALSQATVNISDAGTDFPPTFSIDDVAVTEGTNPTITFTVTKSGTTAIASSVDFTATAGTATAASDYSGTLSGTLNFSAVDTTKQVVIDIVDDTTFEPSEAFTVALSNAVNAAIADNSGTGTIADDDAPAFSINDVSVNEGNAGTTTFTFTVTMSNASTLPVSVDWATALDTASAGDLNSNSGTVNFPALGSLTQTIDVGVLGDTTPESNETFFVNLTNPGAGSISDAQGIGTILNDDSAPTEINAGDASATEGTNPTITFTVTRSGDTTGTSSVNYTVNPGTAGIIGDYTASDPVSGTLNFGAGETTKTVTLNVVDDNVFEPTEGFTLDLSGATGALVVDPTGNATITDNDTPAISIGDFSLNEGTGGPSTFSFVVTLSNPTAMGLSVAWATADGTATVADSDYTSASSTLNIPALATSGTIDVAVGGDSTNEPDENFFVNLSSPSAGSITDAQGVGTIANDDFVTPTFTVNSVALAEGNAGTTAFDFTVTLSPTSGSATSVDVATANGTATTADSDYTANAQTLNFAAGDSTKTFTVLVNGDTKLEGNETFNVTLANATGGAATSGSGVGTINNDDSMPTISIDDVSQFELNAGSSNFTFTVSLSNASASTITVNFATADGTATLANADYMANTNTLVFGPGEVTKTIDVQVNGDTTAEANETFTVTLSTPSGASILDGSGTGTILDDDGAAALVVDDPAVTEGTDPVIVFTVTRSGNTTPAVSVDYTVSPGSAGTPGDYSASDPLAGTLNFATGETSKSVTLNVVNDATFELPESFSLTLSNPSGATISDGTGSGTISDDDAQPTISIGDVTQTEGNAGTTSFSFTVTLSNPSSQTVTVNFATAGGTATSGADFIAGSGPITFPPGVVTQTITVQVNGDTTDEPDETFFVNLSGAANATISDAQATGTITNNDAAVGAAVPALGARELAMLAMLLAAVAMLALKRA